MTVTHAKIAYYKTAQNACACPDRYYRRRDCKHILALREALALVKVAKFNPAWKKDRYA